MQLRTGRQAGGSKDGRECRIAVRCPAIEHMFHSHDPAPDGERDLDAGVEAAILARVRETGADGPFRIMLHLAQGEAASAAAGALPAALRASFARRAAALEGELAEQMATGWRYLAMGMGLLTVCMVLGWALKEYVLREPLGSFVEQGLSVFGWVANWRPVEILLWERLTLHRRIALIRRLAEAEVEVAGR
jgi:hypothetical protein